MKVVLTKYWSEKPHLRIRWYSHAVFVDICRWTIEFIRKPY
jgi:hypothetical protein